MTQHYQAPGVYVEEVPSAVKPIAGVGTSTAAFIGVFDYNQVKIPAPIKGKPDDIAEVNVERADPVDAGTPKLLTNWGQFVKHYGDLIGTEQESDGDGDGNGGVGNGGNGNGGAGNGDGDGNGGVGNGGNGDGGAGNGDGDGNGGAGNGGNGDGGAGSGGNGDGGAGNGGNGDGGAGNGDGGVGNGDNGGGNGNPPNPDDATSFRYLAHAVYGFFHNGGTRCYVVQVNSVTDLDNALAALAAIDEVALVAIPGHTDKSSQSKVIGHCENENLQDRFAILDGEPNPSEYVKSDIVEVRDSDYAAIYFPWIKVFDPGQKLGEPEGDGGVSVPPSGHLAGVYARVDTNRGVHKAPANEVVRGALDVEHRLSRADQAGLNPNGVNVIRAFNGNIKVWGARTHGGDANNEWKYINVRRLFLFLRESIDEGTQWVVFEPNDPALWAKITRNINAFLTNVWRAGALFGATPQEAFYVKCDEETNPPEVRELGRVVTEIGVAVVKPAEFVIFRISQWAGPGG